MEKLNLQLGDQSEGHTQSVPANSTEKVGHIFGDKSVCVYGGGDLM